MFEQPRIAQEFDDVSYEALHEGQTFTSTYEVSGELVRVYNGLVGQPDPPEPSQTAPPWVYCTFLPLYRALAGRMQQGSVHTRQKVDHVTATRIGEVLDVEVRVTAKFERDGKRHVVFESLFYGTGHDLRCRVETALLWGYSA